jgi:hypothetical protein
MTRRYRDQTFRKADVMRAWRAAQAAGIPNPRIEIDRHGTISIIPGEASNGAAAAKGNDLDHWLTKKEKDAPPA